MGWRNEYGIWKVKLWFSKHAKGDENYGRTGSRKTDKNGDKIKPLNVLNVYSEACLNPEIEVPKMFYIAKKKGWNLNKIKA